MCIHTCDIRGPVGLKPTTSCIQLTLPSGPHVKKSPVLSKRVSLTYRANRARWWVPPMLTRLVSRLTQNEGQEGLANRWGIQKGLSGLGVGSVERAHEGPFGASTPCRPRFLRRAGDEQELNRGDQAN